MKNNIGIIIQARTSSTRLPQKIIRQFDGETAFLDVLLSRMKAFDWDIPMVLATTTNPADDVLVGFGEKYQIPVFRGSEENVLERFIECAQLHQFDVIIRVCSDNPFLDIHTIRDLYEQYQGGDYCAYEINGKPSILTHYGFFGEIVSLAALTQLHEAGDRHCMEHVTNCVYSGKNDFEVQFIPKNIPNQHIRTTLDTADDFENLQKIYFDWFKKLKGTTFHYQDLIQYIESQPDLLSKMKNQINKNSK